MGEILRSIPKSTENSTKPVQPKPALTGSGKSPENHRRPTPLQPFIYFDPDGESHVDLVKAGVNPEAFLAQSNSSLD